MRQIILKQENPGAGHRCGEYAESSDQSLELERGLRCPSAGAMCKISVRQLRQLSSMASVKRLTSEGVELLDLLFSETLI
jgi:hypothetical protein